MRIRTIKPEFFIHEGLAELPIATRLLFIGLWGLADVAGRLEDRPKRIKLQVLPWDNVDVDCALEALHEAGFIVRYDVQGKQFIEIPTFRKHQRLTGTEASSVSKIPPCGHPIVYADDCLSGSCECGNALEAPRKHAGSSGKGKEYKNTPHSPPPATAAAPPSPLGGRCAPPLAPPGFPETRPPEGEGRHGRPSPAAPTAAPLAKARAADTQPELVTAILVVTGNDPAKATAPILRAAKKSVAAVLAVEPGLSAEALAAASEVYRRKYRDCVLSPRALARNWSNVAGTAPPPSAHAGGADQASRLDPYCAPPPQWREVLARLHNLDLQALNNREWEDLGTDLRKAVLVQLAPPRAAPQASPAAPSPALPAPLREEVCSGR